MKNNVKNISRIYANKIKEEPSASYMISLPTGQLMINEVDGKSVDKKVNPGTYEIKSYPVDEDTYDTLEGSATAGLNMVVIHFNDNAIKSWKEVKDTDGEEIIDEGNLIDFLMYDQSYTEELENELAEEVRYTRDNNVTDPGMESISEGKAINVYVGEVCYVNKIYWALDKNNEPVKLAGYFEYSSDDNDEEE